MYFHSRHNFFLSAFSPFLLFMGSSFTQYLHYFRFNFYVVLVVSGQLFPRFRHWYHHGFLSVFYFFLLLSKHFLINGFVVPSIITPHCFSFLPLLRFRLTNFHLCSLFSSQIYILTFSLSCSLTKLK